MTIKPVGASLARPVAALRQRFSAPSERRATEGTPTDRFRYAKTEQENLLRFAYEMAYA